MIPNCQRHRWDPADDECLQCHEPYCATCLVYVNGARARPLCIQCALAKSGIRGSRKARPSPRERSARAGRGRKRVLAQKNARSRVRARSEPEVPAAAAAEVKLSRPGWVSLDASRWDIGTI